MRRFVGSLLLCCLPISLPHGGDHSLSLSLRQLIDPAKPAPLLPPDERQQVAFDFEARFACPEASRAEHLFVSLADESLLVTSPGSPQQLRLSLPASRLAAIRGRQHCSGPGLLRLQAQLTAYVSVVCRGQEQVRSMTTSAPVDVWYACPEAGED